MAKCFLSISALLGFLSVVLGAFGAHLLKARLDDYHLSVYQTGVEYLFYHTFAVALVGFALLNQPSSGWIKASGWNFCAGILVFSGSLFALAFTGQRLWGAVTPVGGTLFLVGWLLLGFGFLKSV